MRQFSELDPAAEENICAQDNNLFRLGFRFWETLPQRRRIGAGVGFSVSCLCLAFLCFVFAGARDQGQHDSSGPEAVMRKNAAPLSVCGGAYSELSELEFLGSSSDVRVNLGNKGPDAGQEGMVYHVRETRSQRELELRVNALSEYVPQASRMNGIMGEYGTINLKAGTHVDLNFSFWDPQTGEPAYLQQVAFTFFDLDQDESRTVSEYVVAEGFKHALMEPTTELQQSEGRGLNAGRIKFSASTPGTGQDNPKDPNHLNQEQKNRAITLFYDYVRHFKVTIGATGKGLDSPRWFTFVGRPTLLCTKTFDVRAFAHPPGSLSQLAALPVNAGEIAVRYSKEGSMFVRWLTDIGQKVKLGAPIALMKLPDGKMDLVRAGVQGTVVARQQALQAWDHISVRVPTGVVAVIKEAQRLPSLKATSPDEVTVEVEEKGAVFDQWVVGLNQPVKIGSPVAVFFAPNGLVHALKAPQSGIIRSLSGLEHGDAIDFRVPASSGLRRAVAVIQLPPKLASLPLNAGEAGVRVDPPPDFGTKLMSWTKTSGDRVEQGDTIATLQTIYLKRIEVKSPIQGIVKSRLPLRTGEQLVDRMRQGDCIIAVVEPLRGFSQLPTLDGSVPVASPPTPLGTSFRGWRASMGATVKKDEPIATLVSLSNNSEVVVEAPHDGTLVATQPFQNGQRIDTGMPADIAMLQKPKKLTPLTVGEGRAPVVSIAGEVFQGWKVEIGDRVMQNTVIAAVKRPGIDGLQQILAPMEGIVESLQPLGFGANIDDHTDQPIAVIVRLDGLSSASKAAQWRQSSSVVGRLPTANRTHSTNRAIWAEPSDKFVRWIAGVGDRLRDGSPVAIVKRTINAEGRSEEIDATLYAPTAGTLVFRQKLVEDDRVGDRLEPGDTTVALIDVRQAPPAASGQDMPVILPEAALQGHFTEWAVKSGDHVKTGDELAVIELPATQPGRRLEVGMLSSGQVRKFQVQSPADGLVLWMAELGHDQSIKDAVYEGHIAVIRMASGPSLSNLIPGFPSVSLSLAWHCILAGMTLILCYVSCIAPGLFYKTRIGWMKQDGVRDMGIMLGEAEEQDREPMVSDALHDESTGTLSRSADENLKAIMGSMTVANVEYDAVDRNPALKRSFESECKTVIAEKAGTSPKRVKVILSKGSVKVGYTISVAVNEATGVKTAMATAIRSGGLASDLVTALGAIPGIGHAVTGTIAVTKFSQPIEEVRLDMLVAPQEKDQGNLKPEGVRFDFDDHKGTIHTRYVSHRPLGVSFRRQAPITVNGFHFNSYARSLGVQEGWTIVRVGDYQVGKSHDLSNVKKKIHEALRSNQVHPLRLECKKLIGTRRYSNVTQAFEIDSQPVGITFVNNRLPLVVASVQAGSPAANAGVLEAMQIVQIGDEDMEAPDYKTVLANLQDAAQLLDPIDPSKANKQWRKLSGLDPKKVALSARSSRSNQPSRSPLLSGMSKDPSPVKSALSI